MRFLIIPLIVLSVSAHARYTKLDDALLGGTKSVELILFGKYTERTKGYLNASVGLGYTTGFFYNFRASISFFATQNLFTTQGTFGKDFRGANKTVIGENSILLNESFLEYFDGDTNIKAGRIQPINEYVNNLTDGIWIRNASLKNLVLDGFWAFTVGRVSYYQMNPFQRLGGVEGAGLFSFGAKYFLTDKRGFKDSMHLSAFTSFVPGVFATVGLRWHWGLRLGKGETWLGVDAGIVGSFEDKKSKLAVDSNTFLFDAKVSVGFSWLDLSAGYAAAGQGGLGGINALGIGGGVQGDKNAFYSALIPFFVWGGDAFKLGRNAQLIYAAGRLRFFEDRLVVYVAYGMTFFDGYTGRYGRDAAKGLIQNELDVMTEFSITKTLSVIAYMSDIHLGRGVPNNFLVNAALRFAF